MTKHLYDRLRLGERWRDRLSCCCRSRCLTSVTLRKRLLRRWRSLCRKFGRSRRSGSRCRILIEHGSERSLALKLANTLCFLSTACKASIPIIVSHCSMVSYENRHIPVFFSNLPSTKPLNSEANSSVFSSTSFRLIFSACSIAFILWSEAGASPFTSSKTVFKPS